ncbi:DUF4910 domain-containing protein [Acetobacter sp.]|uniref:DUF4910 domain-containing protein n=1 Tax=Acetobacter sp. TaxID=440 RepID=UPI0039E9F729
MNNILKPDLYDVLCNSTSGDVLFSHAEELFPILRSITGEGIRETLRYAEEKTRNFKLTDIPSGTKVLDWIVPDEWNLKSAKIKNTNGDVLVDVANSSLHIMQYSTAYRGEVSHDVLMQHIFTLPDQPDLIPYKTSYYNKNWGFCISENHRNNLIDPEYRVEIDASLEPGNLTYGEVLIPGDTEEEIFFSIHCCHPSLANDNLSSFSIVLELIRALQMIPRLRFSYRFVFVPGTIGAIAWLSNNFESCHKIRNGLVLSCLGDSGDITYKKSRNEKCSTNHYLQWLIDQEGKGRVLAFEPYGYDERQYCSPGFNLPVGCLMRSPNGTFPEYHTSADNLDFIKPEYLLESFKFIAKFISLVENDVFPVSKFPYGEPQLGRRGLYPSSSGDVSNAQDVPSQMSILWVLNLADGEHSLLDMMIKSGKSFASILSTVDLLSKGDVIHLSQVRCGLSAQI